jgi:small subunit ribosomal protein S20
LPQHKSCDKRMKTSAEERERNRSLHSQVSKSIKALRGCKTRAEADGMINDVISIIDKASRKKVINKKKAARDKSKLMTFVNSLSV